jgi:peroxiredoxin
MNDRKDRYSPADWAINYGWSQATHFAALGWVLHKQGRAAEARAALDSALEMQKENTAAHHFLGQIAEASGNLEEAERYYARGRGFETYGEKPNTTALEKLYEKQHGSLDGYEAYATSLAEKDRDRRWQKIVDSRLKEPRAMPPFSLERMSGAMLDSNELKGKILVVNFWGVWCGPCVHETPELEKFHQKLAADSGAVFLTISNDQNPQTVRDFMAQKKFTFPVLLDEGFVSKVGVHAFPTTWFVDPEGRIQYEHRGASDVVMEEFLWRVELLRGATSRRPTT